MDGQWTCMLSLFSHVWLFATPWTVAHQAPLSMGFSRQEYWSGLPCPPPGDLPDPGIKPTSPESLALQEDSLPGKPVGGDREGLFFLPWIWADLVEVPFQDFWAEASSSLTASAVLKLWTTHVDCPPERKVPSAPELFQLQCLKGPEREWNFMIYSASVQLLNCTVMSKSVLLVLSH